MTIDFFAICFGAGVSLINMLILGLFFYPLIVKQENILLAVIGFLISLGILFGSGYYGAQLEGSGALFFALGFGLVVLIVGAFYPLINRLIGPVDQPSKSSHDTRTA